MAQGARTAQQALDVYLIAAARTGDRRRLALLVQRWDPKFRAHAWRLLGDAEQARDATQDSWAEILRGLRHLRDDAAFTPWAYRIVSRRCARIIASAQRQRGLESALAQLPPPEAEEPGSEAELRAAIRALPPAQRAALALFHVEGLSVAETAVALDVPVGTVKTRLMHARRKLRAVLEGEEPCAISTP